MDSKNKIDNTPESTRAFFDSQLQASGRKWKMRLRMIVAVAGAAATFVSAPGVRAEDAQAHAAVTACVSPIAACGCTITTSGFYLLANDLTSSQGLTADNGCIDIKASKVVLDAAPPVKGIFPVPFNITGPGGMAPSGIGIHVMKGSKSDFIELANNRVGGWDVGILVEGDSNVIEDFNAARTFPPGIPNGTAAVEINEGKNNNINDFTVGKNKNYGVWLRGASNNQINCSNTEGNGNIGVYVGCSANGPINGKCSPAVAPSNNNLIYDHDAGDNGKFGVVIDLGNTGNIVTDLSAFGNGTMDLLDENTNCAGNRWFFDAFDTASPGCIE